MSGIGPELRPASAAAP
jgi:hypothetical protein